MDDARSTPVGRRAGAWIGARALALFAAFEAIFAAWATWLSADRLAYVPQSAISFGVSMAAHALIGAAIGAATTALAARIAARVACDPREAGASLASFAGVLAVAGNAARSWPTADMESKHSLFLSLALALATAASWLGPRTWSWLSGATSPWCAALVLAGAPWITGQLLADSSWNARRGATLAFVAAAAASATLARKQLTSPRAYGAAMAAIALALLGGFLPQSTIASPPAARAAKPGAKHVVLISLDTVRADHMSVYGYERDTTPFLREFASRATLFRQSYSAADFTLASHASLFTGLYARTHGAHPTPELSSSDPLAAKHVTLAERLAEHGYRTIGVAANHVFLAPLFGLQQGFDTYDARARRIAFPKAPAWTLRAWMHDRLYELLPPQEFELVFRRASEIEAAVFGDLERYRATSPGTPLYLFVNFMDAHVPYQPEAPFDGRFARGLEPMRKGGYYALRARVYRGEGELSPEERAELVAHYDDAIASVDDAVRRLFAKLAELGLYEDALIVVTSDHGEAFGEHATLEHGMSVHREQVRVPLIVKLPGQEEGRVVETLASGIDVAPTILAQLGIAALPAAQGRDLFDSSAPSGRTIFAEHYPTNWHVKNAPQRAVHQTAAFWGALQQIRFDDGRLELYDLGADPGASAPLAVPPLGAPDLPGELAGWTAPQQSRGKDRRRTVESLKSLGYAE